MTVTTRNRTAPPARQPRARIGQRTYRTVTDAHGRPHQETWSVTTADGLWTVDRVDDETTTWAIGVNDAEIAEAVGVVASGYGTLAAALEAIAAGAAYQALLAKADALP